jgi:DNA methylase
LLIGYDILSFEILTFLGVELFKTFILYDNDPLVVEWQQSNIEAEHAIKLLTLQVLFDPLMGSGSTEIARLQLNMKFVGTEIDEESYNMANHNIMKFGK